MTCCSMLAALRRLGRRTCGWKSLFPAGKTDRIGTRRLISYKARCGPIAATTWASGDALPTAGGDRRRGQQAAGAQHVHELVSGRVGGQPSKYMPLMSQQIIYLKYLLNEPSWGGQRMYSCSLTSGKRHNRETLHDPMMGFTAHPRPLPFRGLARFLPRQRWRTFLRRWACGNQALARPPHHAARPDWRTHLRWLYPHSQPRQRGYWMAAGSFNPPEVRLCGRLLMHESERTARRFVSGGCVGGGGSGSPPLLIRVARRLFCLFALPLTEDCVLWPSVAAGFSPDRAGVWRTPANYRRVRLLRISANMNLQSIASQF